MPRLTKIEEAIKQIDYDITVLVEAKARLLAQQKPPKPLRPVLAKGESAS